MIEQKILQFPEGFLWGVSTSAYQTEGGAINDWSEWEGGLLRIKNYELKAKKKFDRNNFVCGQACDSYNRYEEDFSLAKDLGCGAFRLGLEWARIEPKKGEFDRKEINHYRQVLTALKAKGMKSVVTLWHWTNPVWLAAEGGWENKKVVEYFSRYTELVARELGGLVDFWITLNEPMAPIGFGYIKGDFPPAKEFALTGAIKVFNNLTKAHQASYQIIHKQNPRAQVSFTAIVDYFEPEKKWNPFDLLANAIARFFHHRYFLNKVKKYIDFIALDYYQHNLISSLPPFRVNKNLKTNDMGWEIFPEGIYHVVKYLAKFGKPIYVIENGIPDEDDDQRREFIKNHLEYLHQAMAEGADVRGYFYWSLLDNFEWAHGFGPKFGLFSVDRQTFKRSPRPSAALYGDICKNNRVVLD